MGRSAGRQVIVTRVLTAMTEREGEPLSLADLCRIAGVSERTLYYAFKQHCNVSPARFLKVHRLQGAFRDLCRADTMDMTIADIANKWGFWHMGQFAKDFRALHGMLPSETRRKAVRHASKTGGCVLGPAFAGRRPSPSGRR